MELKRKVIRQTHAAKEISAFADAGGGVAATSAAHGLSVGDTITIAGTTNYNGTFTVTAVDDANTFDFNDTWVADDGVGMWVQSLGSTDLSEDAEQYDVAVLYVEVTAYTSGTLIVGLETSPDQGTTWYSVANGASIGGTTKQRTSIDGPIGKVVRPVATVSNTPEMSFTVRLELARTGG